MVNRLIFVWQPIWISVSRDAELFIARLMYLHTGDLCLTLSSIVRRAVLNGIEYLQKKLEEQEEPLPETIYL